MKTKKRLFEKSDFASMFATVTTNGKDRYKNVDGRYIRTKSGPARQFVKLVESEEETDYDEVLAEIDSDLIDDNYSLKELFEKLHEIAEDFSNEETIESVGIIVEELKTFGKDPKMYHFCIRNEKGEDEGVEEYSYTIYGIDNNLYYRPTDQFWDIMNDFIDEVPEEAITSLKFEYYSDEEMEHVNINSFDDCLGVLMTVLSEITGEEIKDSDLSIEIEDEDDDISEDFLLNPDEQENEEDVIEGMLFEKWVLKKVKPKKVTLKKDDQLSTDNDITKSKAHDEAKYGTAEDKEFANELSDESNECLHPKLPNVHIKCNKVNEAVETLKPELQIGDTVMFKNAKCSVIACNPDGTYTIILFGSTVDVTKNQLTKLTGNDLKTPKQFEIDPKTKMTSDIQRVPGKHSYNRCNPEDMYKCNVVVDGFRVNLNECYAKLRDCLTFKKHIHVLNENGDMVLYDAENVSLVPNDYENWPWAVVVADPEGQCKPEESIRINPKTYVEQLEDDADIECIVAGKLRTIPRKYVKVVL